MSNRTTLKILNNNEMLFHCLSSSISHNVNIPASISWLVGKPSVLSQHIFKEKGFLHKALKCCHSQTLTHHWATSTWKQNLPLHTIILKGLGLATAAFLHRHDACRKVRMHCLTVKRTLKNLRWKNEKELKPTARYMLRYLPQQMTHLLSQHDYHQTGTKHFLSCSTHKQYL